MEHRCIGFSIRTVDPPLDSNGNHENCAPTPCPHRTGKPALHLLEKKVGLLPAFHLIIHYLACGCWSNKSGRAAQATHAQISYGNFRHSDAGQRLAFEGQDYSPSFVCRTLTRSRLILADWVLRLASWRSTRPSQTAPLSWLTAKRRILMQALCGTKLGPLCNNFILGNTFENAVGEEFGTVWTSVLDGFRFS